MTLKNLKNFLHNRVTSFLLVGSIALGSHSVHAGFLEMPDTSEVPTMKRSSMLKDLDIPKLSERDPDPTSGPRLNVTEFRVQGIVEYPELGITRASLSKLVEGIRFELMSEGDMLESGYTLDEVGEISDLIAEIEDETIEESVSSLDVQRLVFLIREQRQRRGVTVGMIENVADVITRYYRERGFILAKAYIPKQRVRDGVVTLTLLLGDLGEVSLLNNKKVKQSTVEKIFSKSIGKPVTAKSIEEKLFFVNDLPGFTAQAYFEPGTQVGDTKLSINAIQEQSFAGNVRLDTHGSESTGENRLYTDGYWYNPSGLGDQLHIGILGTFSPANSIYGSIHYGLPVFGPRAKFTIGGSSNDFTSTSIEGGELTGTSVVLDSTLNYILKRSRAKNYALEATISQVSSDVDFGNEDKEGIANTTVSNLDLVFNFDVLLTKLRAMHQGGIRLTYGDFSKGRRTFQAENPVQLALNYTLTKFFEIPLIKAQSRIQYKFSGQYSDKALPSTSQFSLTGPSRLRGFNVNHLSSDSAAYMGLDWIFNAPQFLNFKIGGEEFSRMLQPYLFIEGGYGSTLDPGQNIATADATPIYERPTAWSKMSDVGVGFKLSYKSVFHANLSFAHVTSHRNDINHGVGSPLGINQVLSATETQRNKIYFDMQYSF